MSKTGYTTQKWGGAEHLACDACPFTTFDEGTMQRHVRNRHPDEAPAAMTPTRRRSSRRAAEQEG